jgi:Ca2+-binding RTX toxin-like protein
MIDDVIESDTIFGVVSDDIGIGAEEFIFSVDNNGTLILAETVISTDPNLIAVMPPGPTVDPLPMPDPIAPPPVVAPPPVITPPPIVDTAPPLVTPPPMANLINGTDGDDQIFTQEKDDLINAKAGDDVVDSGSGNDVVVAGLGNDRIFSRDGNDTLQGGEGDDFLLAGNGDDILDGSIGNDFLLGEDGNDNLRGGAGNDILHGQNGNDAILGEGGNDIIFGGEGNDSIEGDAFLTFFGLGSNNTLVALDPANLSQPQTLQITGLPSGVSLVGIDRRPADNLLYSLGSDNRVYTLDFYTGAATLVSTLNTPFFNAGDALAGIGFDFNPVPDRLRLVGSNDRNFRINVDTGAVADSNADQAGIQPDGVLAYVAGDVNLGANPNVVAVAYSNNIAGATTTTLFGIDADRDTLLSFVAPNAGTLKTIGGLGFDVGVNASFDILTSLTGDTNVGILVDGNTAYQIDLTTGQATRLGSLGTQPLKGFAIALVPDLTASGDDQLFGGNGNDVISGNFGNDTIYGEGGSDRIFGGAGDDLLFGGDGADLFGFQSNRAFRPGDFGVDVIGDFRVGEDRIALGAASFGNLTAESLDFVADDQLAYGSTRSIVYSQSSGSLFFNADGATAGFGSGGKFAQILGAPTLTASQFVI